MNIHHRIHMEAFLLNISFITNLKYENLQFREDTEHFLHLFSLGIEIW